MDDVITTVDLTKRYGGATVVSGVNLAVPEGCVYGFIGSNGAKNKYKYKISTGKAHSLPFLIF